MLDYKIRPGVGVGLLKLGMDRDRVRRIMGDPQEESRLSYGEGFHSICWDYDEGRLSLDFDNGEGFRLGSITVSHPKASLLGVRLIGLPEGEFLLRAKQSGLGPIVLDDDFSDLGMRDYICDELGLSFWVSDGLLQNIGVMPLYDESGLNPRWPWPG